ncbi:YncE family protein [Pigmentiphaga aceris]|uniref:YncE family protein n=1 Tax=Pigmentiphaga aceris TaxID=1940612 RepID=A0A5C0AY07_9BURK|nr:YncE family protein [Pigmentiphaga aceris]QEI05257.1 YncE family protein [Pigmentiphaga aceris]
MNTTHRIAGAAKHTAFALATLSLTISAAFAAPVFEQPDNTFAGKVMASGVNGPIVAGSEANVTGRGFKPGQQVTLSYGGQVLNHSGLAYIADDKGVFQGKIAVPAGTPAGQHGIVVQVLKPAAATSFDLKVSPVIAVSGQDRFTQTSQKLVPGLYQAAYSKKNDRIFVTAAVGRPPVQESQLLKLDPKTLAIESKITPAKAAGRNDGHVYAVYGVAVNDADDTVWVSETRDNSVAIYRQSDLALVKRLPAGSVPHARDIVFDETLGKAYASTPTASSVTLIDARTREVVKNIEFKTKVRGGEAGSMSLALDQAGHKLYTVTGSTNEAVVIDTRTDTVEKIFALDGAKSAAGVDVDAKNNRLYVASQGSDNLLIVDLASGKTLHNVPVGAGALNVVFDATSGLAYVSNRGAGTTTVVDGNGRIVANLDSGSFPNYAMADGRGNLYLINKAKGKDDPTGDRITKISRK